jgi:hypothetical protein
VTRVALYTAIYGNSDWPKPIPDLGVPCYLYTDDPSLHDALPGWQVRVVNHYVATVKGSPRVTAPMLAHKWWKTHPALACPDVDISIWVDGSMEILTSDYVKLCLEALGSDDWSCVQHPARSCIYPEASFSASLKRYDAPSINAQAEFYRHQVGHPPNWGLIATGANVRRHTAAVVEMGEHWWDECINWSHHDQLSLPVLLRLANGKVPFNYNLPWFKWWHLHEHRGK